MLTVNIKLPLPSVPKPPIDPDCRLTPLIKNVKLLTDVGGSCEPDDGSKNEEFKNVAVLVVTVSAILVTLA